MDLEISPEKITPPNESTSASSNDRKEDLRYIWLVSGVFFFYFLLLTPLGIFSKTIPKSYQTGYFSITQIDEADDRGYYSYLRSGFFDNDIDFSNEEDYYFRYYPTQTGYSHNHYAIGSAILWLPFFLVGHFIALFFSKLGATVLADGYSYPYLILTGIGSSLYVLIGLLMSYRLIRKYCSPFASFWGVITVFLSTPIVYFSFIRQRMSHSGEFFLIVLLVLVWSYWRENGKSNPALFFLGMISGFIFIIRNNTSTFLIIVLLDHCWDTLNLIKQNSWNLRFNISFIKYFAGGVFFLAFPQCLVWKCILGGLFLPTANMYGDLFSNLFNPWVLITHVSNVFFAPDWGLALNQPIWIFGLIGLFFFYRENKVIGGIFGVAVFISLMLTTAFNAFTTQADYGYRLLISCNFFTSLGTAFIVDRLKKIPKFAWILFFFLLILINYLLIIQYKVIFDWPAPNFSLMAYKNIPRVFFKNPEVLIRSSSFFRIISLGSSVLDSAQGWFTLLGTPLIMCSFSVLATLFFLPASSCLKIFQTDGVQRFLKIFIFLFLVFICHKSIVFYKPFPSEMKIVRFFKGASVHALTGNFSQASELVYFSRKFDLSRDHMEFFESIFLYGKCVKALGNFVAKIDHPINTIFTLEPLRIISMKISKDSLLAFFLCGFSEPQMFSPDISSSSCFWTTSSKCGFFVDLPLFGKRIDFYISFPYY